MKYNEIKYIHAKLTQCATLIDFEKIEEFCDYVEATQAKILFKLNAASDESSLYFAVLQNNTILRLADNGYETLSDYLNAAKNAFPTSELFYKAKKDGYGNYEEFKMVLESGIGSKTIFDTVKKNGFIIGLAPFNEWLAQSSPEMPKVANAYELFLMAEKGGFDTFLNFDQSWRAGFKNADVYKAAVERGFTNVCDYEYANNNGFNNASDLQKARKIGVRDWAEFQRYIELSKVGDETMTCDKKLLLILLSKIEQGKKISINKLLDVFNVGKEAYQEVAVGEFPIWFTISLEGAVSIIEFLSKGDHVKPYGHYDTDGEFFQINLLQDRKVIIDGSNVAHNNQGADKKPRAENIITLATFLRKKGFEDISVFADASLRHKLEDKENLERLKNMCSYQEVPAETVADIFIIQYVKSKHCLVVSNDTFRDWKIHDPWVAENIDYYRLSFMIKNNEVLMPDLDRK